MPDEEPSSPPVAKPPTQAARPTAAFAAGLCAVTAVALWLVWPAFTPGRIVNLDAPRHLLRSVVMATGFLPSGHVDGWAPWWYLGAQLFLFQSYGYFFAIGASARLLAPLVGLDEVFKAWYVLPILALPAATAWLALRLGVSRRGAIAAALASITFSSTLGYGMQGLFGVGLLLQCAGVVGTALAWPQVLAVILDRRREPWPVILLVAAVLLCHFITGAWLLAAAGAVAAGVALWRRDAAPVLRYGLLAAAVLLLAAHALLPSLELRELSGGVVGWGNDRERLARFAAGSLFGASPLGIAALVAALWTLKRGPAPLSITAAVFLATGLIGGSNAQGWEPAPLAHILDVLVRPRALPYAGLFQAVFAGVAVDLFAQGWSAAASRVGRPSWGCLATPLAGLVLVAVSAGVIKSQRHFVMTESMLAPRQHAVYLRLVEWLRGNVKPPALVAVPRTLFPRRAIGARSVISLLNLDTGLFTVGGDQTELAKTAYRARSLDVDTIGGDPPRAVAALRLAGVSWLVVSSPSERRRLEASGAVELVHEYQPRPRLRAAARHRRTPVEPAGFAVYRIPGGGQWLQGDDLSVLAMRYSPEHIAWEVRTTGKRASRVATASVNCHPNWTARVDGVAVPVLCSPARRVSFDVAAGASRVDLTFERRPREKLYDAISALTLLGVLVLWVRTRRIRLRAGAALDSGPPPPSGREPS